MVFKTEALVLHYRTLRGADRVYELLSPVWGRISAIARSAGRSTSKLAGHLQGFSHVGVMVARGRQDHLAGVEVVEHFRNINTSVQDFILTSSLVELVLKISVPGQAASREYELLRSALELLDNVRIERIQKIIAGRVFLWRLLALAGWGPAHTACAVCKLPFQNRDLYYESGRGFVCSNEASQGLRLDSATLGLLSDIVSAPDLLHACRSAGRRQVRGWFELTQRYYQDVIGVPMQSVKLFKYI